MLIHNELSVSLAPQEAWEILTDLARVAPCMPGAHLDSQEGSDYHGTVKVRLGAVTAQYKGVARLVETDAENLRAVLEAEGKDTKGQGNAQAKVTATLTPKDSGTTVILDTDLSLNGKVAQFGRSVMAEVSSKLLAEFATRLEAEIAGKNEPTSPQETAADGPAQPASATAAPAYQPSTADDSDAIDLLGLSREVLTKRFLVGATILALSAEVFLPKARWRLAFAAGGIAAAIASYQSNRRGS